MGSRGETERLKGFTEPVALSSPASVDLPPSGLAAFCVLALRSGFDLLALRTRCEGEGTAWRTAAARVVCHKIVATSENFPGPAAAPGRRLCGRPLR